MEIISGTFPTRYRLPVAYSTEIGRIMTRWAFIEWQLEQITYRVVGVEQKMGRLAIKEPRVDAHVAMIADVMKLQKITVSTDLTQLSKGLVELKNFRDAIAHGIWIKHPSTKLPVLQYTKGKWSIASMPNMGRVHTRSGFHSVMPAIAAGSSFITIPTRASIRRRSRAATGR